MSGAPWVVERAVSDSIRAARFWWSDADVPDALSWADVRRRPDLAAAAVERRFAKDWILGQPRLLDYPKPGGGLRSITSLDPLADVSYRQLVGRVVPEIEAALP